ncbi:MAG TPA: ribosomal protein S18-alanine N-acetyltransferase [Verrucomicrobiae bacterium]|nr:ribosomal protein S18-alanine N-acetyltransferase [Verrucomicrobiae bacterium]
MASKTIHTRPLEHGDIEEVLAIQSESPEIAPWSVSDYERVARNEMAGWVALNGTAVVGFLIARRVISDVEILNFAVAASFRRRGAGTTLLTQALDWAKSFGAEKALLEVRISNLAAIRFYERHRFEVVGRRPRYYTSPLEDALLLTASLPGESADE